MTDTPLLLPLLLQATVLGLTHSSTSRYMPVFQPCDPVWCLESGHFPDPCILLVLPLVKADCWTACICHIIPTKACAPENPSPHFSPAHSFLVTPLVPHPRHVCVAHLFQIGFSGTRSKFTAPNLRCRMTSEVGVVFSQTFSEFLVWFDLCVVSLAQPHPYPKFPVISNGWIPWSVCPARFLLCFPSVCRWIWIYRFLLPHCCHTKLSWIVCQRQFFVP